MALPSDNLCGPAAYAVDPAVCPHCTADLSGGRVIGIKHEGRGDGVTEWQCPDCDGRWLR